MLELFVRRLDCAADGGNCRWEAIADGKQLQMGRT